MTFASRLLAQGIELVLRGNRLWVWPAKAHQHLTDEDKEFMREHRDDLKALAASKVLPEATVVWAPPSTVEAASPTPQPAAEVPHCPYCGARRCVGMESPWYRLLHWDAPEEVARRDRDASAVMLRMMRFGHPHLGDPS